MNKHYLGLTLAILFAANPIFAQDSNPIKWGLSVGTGQTTYEQGIIRTEEDGSQNSSMQEVDFSPTIVSIDARSGKHQVSFSTNTADDEQLTLSGSIYEDGNATRTADYDDQSFTYTYSLSNEWKVSLGYNSLSQNTNRLEVTPRSNVFVTTDPSDDWALTETVDQTQDRTGATALVSYVRPLGGSGKWIGVGRVGFTAQDYEVSGPGSTVVSGLSASTESCYAGITCNVTKPNTLMNGDGYDYSYKATSDSTSVVVGFSLIYVFANPRHTLNLDFSVRDNDYGELDVSQLTETPRGGWFTENSEEQEIDLPSTQREIEETLTSVSLKWRYGLN
jgi:hypothetical protein